LKIIMKMKYVLDILSIINNPSEKTEDNLRKSKISANQIFFAFLGLNLARFRLNQFVKMEHAKGLELHSWDFKAYETGSEPH
jgi:hypothetical protein